MRCSVSIYKKLRKIIFILIPIYIFIIALCTGYPLFETNDDVYLMDVLSGNIIGEPYAVTSYFHVFLGFVISSLYRLAYFPWFPIFIIACNLLGQMAIYAGLYDLLQKKNVHAGIKLFVLIFMLPISSYLCFLPSYTTSATLIGVVSIYLLYKDKRVLSLVCLALATAIRMQSGFVVCAFWGLSYIYLHFLNNKKFTWDFFIKGLLVIVLVFGVYASDELIKAQVEPKGYREFRIEQSNYNDFAKKQLSDEELTKTIAAAGWDNELYELSKTYFSFDDRITADSYKVFNAYNRAKNYDIDGVSEYLKYIAEYQLFLIHLIVFPILFLLVYIVQSILARKRSFWLGIALLFVYLLGAIYLAMLGRIIFTSALAIVLPVIMAVIMLFVEFTYEPKESKANYIDIAMLVALIALALLGKFTEAVIIGSIYFAFRINFKRNLAILLALAFGVSCGYIAYDDNEKLIAKEKYECKIFTEQRRDVEDYCIYNPQNIFVLSLDMGEDGVMMKDRIKYNNMFAWGSTNVHSSAFNIQMEKAGLSEFDMKILLQPNVYFITSMPERVELLHAALSAKGYENTYEYIDGADYMGIYKFK